MPSSPGSGAPDLARLRKLDEAATQAPWRFRDNLGCKDIGRRLDRQNLDLVAYTPGRVDEAEDRANARLIVEMRNALPALLDEVDALREALGQTDHFIVLTEDGWSIEHLVSCRPDMTKCAYHREADRHYRARPPVRGRFRILGLDPWVIEPAPAEGAADAE